MNNRRTFLQRTLGAGAALFTTRTFAQSMPGMQMPPEHPAPSPVHTRPPVVHRQEHTKPRNTPVITTEVGDLPHTLDGNTKVFHLIAEVLKQQIHPDKTIDAWGFNGSAPGPTIQVNQGDHVRVIFEESSPGTKFHPPGMVLKTR